METYNNFYKDDRIYKILFSRDSSDNIIKTVDTSIIYKIVSVRNEFFGDGLTKFVSIDSSIIIPENETSIKEFGEYLNLQKNIDGIIITQYAVKINDIPKNI